MPIPVPTDPDLLESIGRTQAAAAAAREQAISLSHDALGMFEKGVAGHFSGVRKDTRLGLSADDVIDQGEELSKGPVAL